MEENYFWAPSLLPIKSKNTDKLFFLFHVWDYNGEKMLMYLTDCENTWSQVVGFDHFKKSMNSYNLENEFSLDRYLDCIKSALHSSTINQMKKNPYWCELVNVNATSIVIHCKMQLTDKMALKFCALLFEQKLESSQSFFLKFFLDCFEYTKDLRQDVITLQKENKTLSLQRDFALSELKKAAELKKILEESLYAKFIMLLNEKKAKIVQLKEQIEDMKKVLRDEKHREYKPSGEELCT